MSGINIIKKFHGKPTSVTTTWAATDVAYTSCSEITCSGFTKLLVQYYCSSGWDRAGDIQIWGAIYSGGTYTIADSTVENGTFSVASTDDAGEYYIVKNIPMYIKLAWNNTTAGATGTITVIIVPINE